MKLYELKHGDYFRVVGDEDKLWVLSRIEKIGHTCCFAADEDFMVLSGTQTDMPYTTEVELVCRMS